MTRILVVGAGAIGGYFGGRMLAVGSDVTFLVRPGRAAQLAKDGLVIRSPGGDLTVPAPTVTADTLHAPFDAVLLSCKAYDLDGAIGDFAPAVGPATRIVPLLNGMRHMEVLAERFGVAAVLGGQCQISTTLEPDGTIRQFGAMQAVSLGVPGGGSDPVATAMADALAPCGGRLSATVEQDMWDKWVFITSLAATTCLMRATVGDVVAAEATEISLGILGECIAIAGHCGHPPGEAATTRFRTILAQPGSPLTASMLRDVERGNRTEVDHVLGDLLTRGEPGRSPLLRVAYLHLKAYEARRSRT